MTRFVALLRGVNVNGITVKSAELAELFRSLGFAEVRTVLASGNVVFETTDARDPAALKTTIEAALATRFGYDAWIVLLPHARLAAAVAAYPFAEDEATHPYVVFTSSPDVLADLTSFASTLAQPPAAGAPSPPAASITGAAPAGERAEPGDGVLYWQCPRGSSTDTPLAKHLARATYRATTTTRNLRTLRKLL
ncbi:DUF1697 domain-containing protein [Herbiconiux sp. VKM Ac-1786]|uniref:DUF1697 domain-containing protein n=1 Tax=Herbiconiux sp. VKM Ac-1786 TaxID=2783824 RepID=UPI00188B5385|nr:DUF1697 domain-containing protein [Herbiconiux sp. VKM Ac-1786]MBF4571602.1 DUF1697 domain-containing protein [Herbiconiux sp. VKM Ac-1786]